MKCVRRSLSSPAKGIEGSPASNPMAAWASLSRAYSRREELAMKQRLA